MFCENCGTRVEDGQPFCPNCGSKMPVPEAPEAPAAPVTANPEPAPVPGYIPPAAPVKEPKASGGFLGKLNDMTGMEKIWFLCIAGLLVTCVLVSLFKLFYSPYYGRSYHIEANGWFLSRIITILFALSITFFVMDYFDWFNLKYLWFALAGAAGTIFLAFIIIWINSGDMLNVMGWFFLFLLASLVAATVLMLIEKLKKK